MLWKGVFINQTIIDALGRRFSVKTYDPNRKVSEENVRTVLESARLAPSSYGVEPWRFVVVENPAIRQQLREAALGQSPVTDASHLIVVARRTLSPERLADELVQRTARANHQSAKDLDGLKQGAMEFITAQSKKLGYEAWTTAQTYIPLGIMIYTAALLGLDSGPMEGFDTEKVDEILSLKDKQLTSVVLFGLGVHDDEKHANRPKTRHTWEEAVEFVT